MLKNLLLERQSLVINGSNAANKTFNLTTTSMFPFIMLWSYHPAR